ncbi:hypothetical protein GWK47_044307 [Chionoecetes opilio]|uniref:RAE1/2 domain-containing protein n=1 Tax=Chionoecetes opilio TaxID=41210 RepID=A0A8J4YF84_CHIOP|nr:hypothetical protein GWK47_044307 [Chionoecetes opilio]
MPKKREKNAVETGPFGDPSANEKEQLTLLRVPAKVGNPHPVIVLEVGPGPTFAPRTCNAESDLRVAVERLLTTEPDDTSNKPRMMWSLYFNQVRVRTAEGRA